MIRRSVEKRLAQGSAIAELAPVIWVLVLMVFFPLTNMVGLATGSATGYLLTSAAADSASVQQSYPNSLDSMNSTAKTLLKSAFATFAKCRPVGGYQSCGVDLYTNITSAAGKATQVGPNKQVPPPIDLTDNVYEFTALGTFDIGPVVSLENLPWLADVPGLGKPARMVFKIDRMVEHPQGLSSSSQNQSGSGTGLPSNFNRTLVGSGGAFSGGPSTSGYDYRQWRDSQIYQQIASSGQSVVSENVVLIAANLPWQSTGVNVLKGQQVWVDTNAVGLWSVQPAAPSTDANGDSSNSGNSNANHVDLNATSGALIAFAGANPPAVVSGVQTTNPNMFQVGDTMLNHMLANSGPLSLMINDNVLGDNSGAQLVRVIVTN